MWTDAAEGLGVLAAAGETAVACEGGFGVEGGVFGGVKWSVADEGHEFTQPGGGGGPIGADVHEGVGGEVDGMAGSVVVPIDLGWAASVVLAGQAGGLEKGGVADGGGDLVVGVAILPPEHEGDVWLDVGDDLGDFFLEGEAGFKSHAGVVQEAHLDSAFGC